MAAWKDTREAREQARTRAGRKADEVPGAPTISADAPKTREENVRHSRHQARPASPSSQAQPGPSRNPEHPPTGASRGQGRAKPNANHTDPEDKPREGEHPRRSRINDGARVAGGNCSKNSKGSRSLKWRGGRGRPKAFAVSSTPPPWWRPEKARQRRRPPGSRVRISPPPSRSRGRVAERPKARVC